MFTLVMCLLALCFETPIFFIRLQADTCTSRTTDRCYQQHRTEATLHDYNYYYYHYGYDYYSCYDYYYDDVCYNYYKYYSYDGRRQYYDS